MGTRGQQGVALAIVVWFLAAMSLLVAGIVMQAKVDTRLAQAHVARAKAVAAGDGAIQLMLASLKSNEFKAFRGRGVPAGDYIIGDIKVEVSLVPVSGLIDLNGAPKELLEMLFKSSGEASNAQLLASNVIKWREQRKRESLQAFYAIEDLMHVEGVNRTIFEQVRDVVAVGQAQQAGVDWMSAPESVLGALTDNDASMVSAIVDGRGKSAASNTAMPRGMSGKFQTLGGGSTEYRMDARVTVGDKQWLRRRWVSMGSGVGSSILPWHYTRTEAVRAVAAGQKKTNSKD